MRCFYHSQIEAIGSCQACAKGLCRECAHSVDSGVVCKGYCEDKVLRFQNLAQSHAKSLAGSGRTVWVSSASTAAAGIFLILIGIRFPGPLFLVPLLGIACVLMGLSCLYLKRDVLKDPGPLRQPRKLEAAGANKSVREPGER